MVATENEQGENFLIPFKKYRKETKYWATNVNEKST